MAAEAAGGLEGAVRGGRGGEVSGKAPAHLARGCGRGGGDTKAAACGRGFGRTKSKASRLWASLLLTFHQGAVWELVKSSFYSPNFMEHIAHCDHKPRSAWVFMRLVLHRHSATREPFGLDGELGLGTLEGSKVVKEDIFRL